MRAGFGWAFGVLLLGCGSVSEEAPCASAGSGSSGSAGQGGASAGAAGAAASAGLELAGSAGALPSDCGPTDDDPVNCGRCGNVCPLGVCTDGACVDVPGVSLVARAAPAQIVGDGRYLYWMSTEVTLDVGPNTVIVRCSVDGCPDGAQGVTGTDRVGPFALADGFFTLQTGTNGATGVTRRCIGAGCISEFTKLGNATAEQQFEFFSVTATHVAYAMSTGAFVAPLNGALVGTPTLLFESVDYLNPVALSLDHLLAASSNVGGEFFPVSCPLTGCDNQPTPLGPPTQYSPLVAVNGTDAFWLDPGTSLPVSNTFRPSEFHDGGVYSCPLTGCEEPSRLAAIDEWNGGPALGEPGALAVDETDVYFTTAAAGERKSASLVRCARTGCGREPTEIAHINELGRRPSIVLDAKHVYWVDYATGSILKREK